jgi:hypothetical protein
MMTILGLSAVAACTVPASIATRQIAIPLAKFCFLKRCLILSPPFSLVVMIKTALNRRHNRVALLMKQNFHDENEHDTTLVSANKKWTQKYSELF